MPEEEQGVTPYKSEAVKNQIQGWLMEEGWNVGLGTPPDAEWFLTGVDPGGRHIGVGQKRGTADQIIIQGSVTVADEHQTLIEGLDQNEKADLIFGLRVRLVLMNVEFGGVGLPLKNVTINQRIYFDGLTKDTFLQRVSSVRNGVLAVLWTIGYVVETKKSGRPSMGFRI